MGRAAHPSRRSVTENRKAMVSLLGRIDAVLRAPGTDSDVDELERLLTDGYAEALAIEAETLRLDKRLASAARELGDGSADKAHELTTLAHELDERNGELAALRHLLAELRTHTESLRVGAVN
jgi:predicted  nucleic acid-binding Zn-ribbon protein